MTISNWCIIHCVDRKLYRSRWTAQVTVIGLKGKAVAAIEIGIGSVYKITKLCINLQARISVRNISVTRCNRDAHCRAWCIVTGL